MQLTKAQETAVNTREKTLLLSAAAGSGKTSTLTKRIIASITAKENPSDISKMLIVTFTRASANDLKTKIFNAISDALASDPTNKHLTEQLIKLGGAKISTIDAFYLGAVKQNFSVLGLSSAFRICDSSEASLIAKNVMDEIIDLFYDTDSEFPAFCECFEKIRDTESVSAEALLSIYEDCMSVPEGVEYLRICADNALSGVNASFTDTDFGNAVKDYAIPMFTGYLEYYDGILEKMSVNEKLFNAYYDAMNNDRLLCIKALKLLKKQEEHSDYADVAELFNSFEFQKLKSLQSKYADELSKFAKSLRDNFKKDFNYLRSEFFCCTDADFAEFFSATAKNLGIAYRVLTAFEKRFTEEKKRRNILELTDIKRYALKLFTNGDGTPSAIADSYAEQFTDIYIDEYQDVDPVQDLIFRCISKSTNRFMVGDIKQSIYSFRGAKPQLFADYRARFPINGSEQAETSDCQTIFMSENFRCAKPIIDFTNSVCAPAFKACGDSIGYTSGDDLVCAKASPSNAPPSPKVTVAIFAKNSQKAIEENGTDASLLPSPAEAEAKYIAYSIKKLLQSGKKEDGSPIMPSDIAVLFRNRTYAQRIADELSFLGISSSCTESTQYFQNPDVMMVLCILNAVDNPQRDIYLAGAMRSPIFGFTLDELLIINGKGEKSDSLYDKLCIYELERDELAQKCRTFNSTLNEWRSISSSLPIDKFLNRIFSSEAFVASGLVCEKNSAGEGGNLQRLYEYARTFEAGSFKGLYSFIEFINNIIDNGETLDSCGDGTAEDSVTLTTVHKSKGLEFPVCFVCCCASGFKYGSLSDGISFEYGMGVAMTLSDSTGFAEYTSPLKKALDLYSRQKSIEEEMRVLYVALTRAKEQLFVTANYPRSLLASISASSEFKAKFNCDFSLLNADCFMDWILPALKREAISCAEFYEFTTDALPEEIYCTESECPERRSDEKTDINFALYGQLKKSFSFSYPYTDMKKIPAKLSVSKLSPDIIDETDTSVKLFDVEKTPSVPNFFIGTQKKPSASERGTATHLFLQFCDFSSLKRNGTDAVLQTLTEKKFIPESLAQTVYKDELEKLRFSDFTEKILNSDRVIREQRFNILLPTAEFTQNSELKMKTANEKIAVQGVIDLILIDKQGNIELYDYKTDRLSAAELKNPALAAERMNKIHGLQLSYYEKAIEYLFGRLPKRTAVYSTHSGLLYDICTKPLTIDGDIL